ncbi:hypothetical protein GCM10017559_03900 [Streptosporangium longisporum]|uniref:Uncharacterized protein n=1 Tax=Streptosporangium longisporum TaxID=46187 RepID=A0ABP6K9H4_9ACTN
MNVWAGRAPWPGRVPIPTAPGRPGVYRERFATLDGRAHLAACPYLPPGESPDDHYSLILATGRRWTLYNSGGMNRGAADPRTRHGRATVSTTFVRHRAPCDLASSRRARPGTPA